MAPWRTGLTFAITVVVFSLLCTIAWVVAPGPFVAFVGALFHGLDFSTLARTAPVPWTHALVPALVLGVWAFAAGSFFAWLHARLAR